MLEARQLRLFHGRGRATQRGGDHAWTSLEGAITRGSTVVPTSHKCHPDIAEMKLFQTRIIPPFITGLPCSVNRKIFHNRNLTLLASFQIRVGIHEGSFLISTYEGNLDAKFYHYRSNNWAIMH